MNIQGLINKGIAQLRQEKAEAVATREEEEREQEEKHKEKEECTIQLLKAAVAEEIRPFANYHIKRPYPNEQQVNFVVPGCCELLARYKWQGHHGEDKFALGIYSVIYATRVVTAYKKPPKLGKELHTFDDLTRALGFAAIRFKREEELRDDLAKAQAEHEDEQEAEKARYEEAERTEEESYARRQAERAQENTDLERTLDIIRNDPTALALVRIFIAVQEERLDAEEALGEMSHMVDSTERRYRQRLDDAQSAADAAQGAQASARRQADDAQRRAYEAEDDLEQAKRKAKRGW